jgi:hypothetical protein
LTTLSALPSVAAATATRDATMTRVPLHMTLLNATAKNHEWVQKPFVPTQGFNMTWWVGSAKGPVVWCMVTDPALGEVARAQIRPESRVGVAYPTRKSWPVARLRSTCWRFAWTSEAQV